MTLFFPGVGKNHVQLLSLSGADPLKDSAAPDRPEGSGPDSYVLQKKLKAPAQKTLSPFLAEYDGKILKKISIKPASAAKEKREDDAKTLKAGLNDAVRPAFENMLKKYEKFSARVLFTISYDNSNGQVIQVTCEDLTFKNNPSNDDKIKFLVEAANSLRSQFRFKKIDDGFGFFKARFNMGVFDPNSP